MPAALSSLRKRWAVLPHLSSLVVVQPGVVVGREVLVVVVGVVVGR